MAVSIPQKNSQTGASVEPLIEHLSANLADLEGLVKKRLFIAAQKANLIRQLGQVSIVAQRMIAPGARILEAQIAEWNNSSEAATSNQLSAERSAAAKSIVGLIPQKNAAALIDTVHNILLKIADVEKPSEIDVLLFPLRKSLANLSDISRSVPTNIKIWLVRQIELFEALAVGPNSLAVVRRDELAIVAQAEELLTANSKLSGDLTTEVNRRWLGPKATSSMRDHRLLPCSFSTGTSCWSW